MSKFVGQAETIMRTLGLEWEPLAVRFSDEADARGDSTRKLRICEAFDVVRRERTILNFSKENCICPGGRHFTGLEPLPLETVAGVWTRGHKAYESMDVALASLRKQPQPIKRGDFVILGPLSDSEIDPSMVALFVNPEQADRVLGLASFKGAEPFTFYPVNNICSTITNSLAKDGPEINFLAMHSRKLANWSPNELIIAMPFRTFEKALDDISRSEYGTERTEGPKV